MTVQPLNHRFSILLHLLLITILMAVPVVFEFFELGILLTGLLFVYFIYVVKKPIYLMSMILIGIPTVGSYVDFVEMYYYKTQDKNIYILSTIIGLAFLLTLIDFIKERRYKAKGVMNLPFLLLFLVMSLSLYNTPTLFFSFVGIFMYLLPYYLYLYLRSVEYEKTHLEIFSYSLEIFFLFMATQLLFKAFHYEGDLMEYFYYRGFNLHYAITNDYASFMVMIMPFMAYLVTRSRFSLHHLLLLASSVLLIVFTWSRNGVGDVFLMSPFLLFGIFYYSKNKWQTVASVLLVTGICVFLFNRYVDLEWTLSLVEKFKDSAFYFKDRGVLIEYGLNKFREHPIIGTGHFSTIHFLKTNTSYHNAFVEFLSNTGILGLMAFLFWLWRILFTFVKKMTAFNYFSLVAFIGLFPFLVFNTQHQNPINLVILTFMVLLSETHVE